MVHRWTKDDDIVAYYIYRYGTNSVFKTVKDISEILGLSESSLKMRIANFKAIDGNGGLKNYAKQSEEVYHKFKSTSRELHLKEVNAILKE